MAATAEGMSALLKSLRRITFVDIVLWGMRILIVFIVVGGTYGTLTEGRYTGEQWFDNVMFGLTIGGIYALIALGYTMVYGILRLINFCPRRHHHDRGFHRLFFGDFFVQIGLSQCAPGNFDDHDNDGLDGGVLCHRSDSRAHLLPAVSSCGHPCPADLRHRCLVFSPALVSRHVRLLGALVSGPFLAQG